MGYYTYIYIISISLSILWWILVWRQQKNISGFFFFLFSIFSSLWFTSYYLFFSWILDENILLYISRFWFGIWILAAYSFLYYIIFFWEIHLVRLHKKVFIHIFLYTFLLWIYIFTDLIISDLEYVNSTNIYREVIGSYYFLHILLHSIAVALFCYFSFKKIRTQDLLNKIRLKNILFSAFIVFLLLLLFQLILPYFGIWILEKEIIFLFTGFVLYVNYTVRRYYFSQIWYWILRFTTTIISLVLAISITDLARYFFVSTWANSLWYWITSDWYSIYDTIVAFLLYFLIYKWAHKLFLWNYSDREITSKIENLKKSISFVTDLNSLNQLINSELLMIFRTNSASIILYTEEDEKNLFLELHTFLSKNEVWNTFINDRVFIEKNKNLFSKNKIISEIPKDSFLIFWLHNSRGINIGILRIWAKKFGDFYTLTEINILKEFAFFLEIHLKYIRTYATIEELSTNLDKKVDEKTIEYNNVINRQKEFIGIISHEIRSPLWAAIFQSDSIMDDLDTNDIQPEKLKEELSILNKQLVRTWGLISKLFSVQYYDTHSVNLFRENIEFAKFLEYEVELFSHVYSNVTFRSKIDKKIGFVSIDKIQIQQVINNLLDNAVKFLDDNNPTISISAYKKWNNLTISIEDNGKWFEWINIKDIFDKYSTGSHWTVWLGMGLYLCKKIISMHNGTIEASTSDSLKGAAFSISIPII